MNLNNPFAPIEWEFQRKHYQVIKEFIDLASEMVQQKIASGHLGHVDDPVQALTEYRTIGFHIPRQSGATFLTQMLMSDGDAVIVEDSRIRDGLIKSLQNVTIDDPAANELYQRNRFTQNNLFHLGELQTLSEKPQKFNRVFLMDARRHATLESIDSYLLKCLTETGVVIHVN